MKRDEVIANVVIIAFFIFMLIRSFKLHQIRRFGEMGSGFWPMLILSTATLLSMILLISTLIRYLKEKKKTSVEVSVSKEALVDLKNRRRKFVLSVILLFVYVIIMPWIGFVLSTLIYVLAFILALEERRKYVLAISPILVTALIVIIFTKFIVIPFPRGVGIFAAFSRLIY
jgi:TRAP-type C4-dicarboxylate transport system permease small subunit